MYNGDKTPLQFKFFDNLWCGRYVWPPSNTKLERRLNMCINNIKPTSRKIILVIRKRGKHFLLSVRGISTTSENRTEINHAYLGLRDCRFIKMLYYLYPLLLASFFKTVLRWLLNYLLLEICMFFFCILFFYFVIYASISIVNTWSLIRVFHSNVMLAMLDL